MLDDGGLKKVNALMLSVGAIFFLLLVLYHQVRIMFYRLMGNRLHMNTKSIKGMADINFQKFA
ncbi:hypothetical protein OQJ02_05145 [Legionella sp. PATHC032]|uniref:hypothetical protein n=1 Tax=Legionella sp. PATHC032 TaxID=2992039 RepID=UPI001B0AD239|nr:hypothetical protein [Legionella sp. PATHC032]MCW8421016.1 hypothetical protein [Legionella sp. PATHC032]HAZ7573811.1 hypothetical protein [Legionella pneumophila]HBA1634317.1 hypothetical protein [Legionella pneumophila]